MRGDGAERSVPCLRKGCGAKGLCGVRNLAGFGETKGEVVVVCRLGFSLWVMVSG